MPKIIAPPSVSPASPFVAARRTTSQPPVNASVLSPVAVPKRGELWHLKAHGAESSPREILALVVSADGIGSASHRHVAAVVSGKIEPLEFAHCVPIDVRPCTRLSGDFYVDLFLLRLMSLDGFLTRIGQLSADNLEDVNLTNRMLYSGG